jgi:sugar lactone lactonase YvrE
LLVVSKVDRKVLRLEPDHSLVQHADLSDCGDGDCNDMVVDSRGRAYVGELGFDPFAWFGNGGTFEDAPTATLFRVDSDGSVAEGAIGLRVPNGAVLLDDEQLLIVAESFASQLTAFDVDPVTGGLSGRRVWAALPGRTPDGICADESGRGIWVADARHPECIRVEELGVVTETVATTQKCFACALGGPDGRTLYCATAPATDEARASAAREGRIEHVQLP